MDLAARTLDALDWPVVIERLAAAARTRRGSRAARVAPLACTREEVASRYTAVAEILAFERAGDSLPVGAVLDVGEAVDRAARGAVLEPGEIKEVGLCLRGLAFLRAWLDRRAAEVPTLARMGRPVEVEPEILETIERAFDASGDLADAAWPELADLRRAARAAHKVVDELFEQLLRSEALGDLLQDRYVTDREGRRVLPVKAARRTGLGIVHDVSGSGETAFVEPAQAVEPQNRMRSLEAAVRREEHRILALLSSLVGAGRPAIEASLEAAAALDLACARASFGHGLGGTIPRVGTEGVVALEAARHPLLVLRGVAVVPNDLGVDATRPGLVLTGPNAGGKTVALKTLGLAALFVRAGIPFPAAEGSRVDLFDPVLADVGDLQAVERDLSTFSARILALRSMIDAARPGALLLVDEVASGTDPAQGAALARAAIEAMVSEGARVVVTTHYDELKVLAASDGRFRLAGARYEDGRPTFRIVPDRAGRSHAFGVARRLGVPAAVIDRAADLLGRGGRDLDALLQRAEEDLASIERQGKALEAQEAEVGRRDAALHEREEALRRRTHDLERRVAEGFGRRLDVQERRVRALVAALQADPDLARAGRTLAEIRALRAAAEPVEPASAVERLAHRPEIGDRVAVPSLGIRARVVQVGADRVEVEAGSVRSWIPVSDLGATAASDRPKTPLARSAAPLAGAVPFGGVPSKANTLDLRGRRLEEAREASESFFDACLLRGEPVAWLLHGHGTGVLKSGLRGWLSSCRYVRRWRPAAEGEGGDAWTVVELS
ncbi:MAG: Smr/MutS family protein [Deltaproteobacteria bacterium]|nr:Smr/MutS family protein [Deltaproteobacteria bacterium]